MGALGNILTPGTPIYAVLKLGLLAGVAGLSFAARRRGRHASSHSPDDGRTDSAEAESTPRAPHPRSQKKRRRRRR